MSSDHHRPHHRHHYHKQAQPHYQRTAGRASSAGFTSAAAGAVPIEERLFGQGQVRRMAEEVFAALPENKLALLTIGFVTGGAAAKVMIDRSHTARLAESRSAGEISR